MTEQELFDRLDAAVSASSALSGMWVIRAAKPIISEAFTERDDELAALREENERLNRRLFPGQGEGYANEVERQRSVIDGLQHVAEVYKAAVQAVRGLHTPTERCGLTACNECSGVMEYQMWPCPTESAIREAMGETE